MTRASGVRIGDYELVEPIGRGGMGEVWRAHDRQLNRHVALKFLNPDLALDRDRLRRFEREAQVLATLNDARIAAIYGLTSGPDRALVLELVDGDTLADRIRRGPLPPAEARTVAVQLAEAVAAAHERGIVHRDLKPANIKITPAGAVKVLDFGIAKAMPAPGTDPGPTLTESMLVTTPGTVLGTRAYMSPEQMRGEEVDERADVWAFGCVLFEMLTGVAPFRGDSAAEVVAAVLERQPDFSLLPAATPPALRLTLERCLRKDPRQRLRAIADARLELEDESIGVPRPPRSGARALVLTAIAAAASAAIATAVLMARRESPVVPVSQRHDLLLREGDELSPAPSIAISRDGRLFAYSAVRSGTRGIVVRRLDADADPLLAGTDGGIMPFFSPDGAWVGFLADGKLKKVPSGGGAVVTICDAPVPRGAAWGDDNAIVFAPNFFGGLAIVSADGGEPRALTMPEARPAAASHRWPAPLPRGLGVLYTEGPVLATQKTYDAANIVAQRLDGSGKRVVITGGTAPHYSPTGHLLFARGTTLFAVEFDAERLEARGAPVVVLEDFRRANGGSADVAATGSGWLAAATGAIRARKDFAWVARDGAEEPLPLPPAPYLYPRLSPDGRHVSFTLDDDVWTYDIARDTRARLTFEGINFWSIWSRDGRRIAFTSNRVIPTTVYVKPSDGSGTEVAVGKTRQLYNTSDWLRDGSAIAFNSIDPLTGSDVSVLTLADGESRPFVKTAASESGGTFSPDGRWIAYASNMSGRSEVFVGPYPSGGVRWQVSTDGGAEPLWGASGRALYFRNGDSLLQVTYTATSERFDAGKPVLVFRKHYATWANLTFTTSYGIAPDERRFLMLRDLDVTPKPRIRLLANALPR